MDAITPGNWISIAQFLWLIGLTVGAYLRKPGDDAGRAVAALKDATDSSIRTLRDGIAELRSSQALMDERMRHLPTHVDIRALIDGMADMRGKLGALADGQRAQQNTLQLIQEFLNTKR